MRRTAAILLLLGLGLSLGSCSTVRVSTDYDTAAKFDTYKTYAFYKPGIDKAEISDLDKKRILHAIDAEMAAKGFAKSETPDVLVSIFTEASERVDVWHGHWGWGGWWGPGWGVGWGWPYTSSVTEGTLYIDLIDAGKNELVWQGMGTASLYKNKDKRDERTREIVAKILEHYPPNPE